jgi:hypothetical protein
MPPTASSYIAGIDVVTRNSAGFITALEVETVKIRYFGGADIATLVSGNQGAIESQFLTSVPSETEIEFYSPTKAGTLRMTTGRAADSVDVAEVTLILDDDYTDTKASKFADIYLKDTTFHNVALRFLGTMEKGKASFPFETAWGKEVQIMAHSRTDDYQYAKDNLEDSLFAGLTITGYTDLKRSVLITEFSADINTTSPQAVLTVPSGNQFVFTKARFSGATESLFASTETLSVLDKNGAAVIEQSLAEFSTPEDYKRSYADQSVIYRAGDSLALQTSGAYGSAAQIKVTIYGYYREAD